MASPHESAGLPDFLAPLGASSARALGEAMAGCAVLLALSASFTSPRGGAEPASIAFALLAWTWLACWPAWRLRRIRGRRWWKTMAAGLTRATLIAGLLGVVATLLTLALLRPLLTLTGRDSSILPYVAFPVAFGFLLVRAPILLAAALRGRIVRRLRWQLMVSHAAVIVLVLTSMTAVGSILGTSFVLVETHVDAGRMAGNVEQILVETGSVTPLNPGRARAVLTAIESGHVRLEGEPRLAGLVGASVPPARAFLARLDGAVVVGAQHRDAGGVALDDAAFWARLREAASTAALSASPGIWTRFQRSAARGLPDVAQLRAAAPPGTGGLEVAEAPVLSSAGHPVAMAVVEVMQPDITPAQFFRYTLAIFGLATLALILATSLPILALSGLFAYLFARTLTRRLEAVSNVATAIASGNLTERAPVSSQNEIGRLAQDINRMADHLETAMGELRGARADAEEALRARQELVASISHELRTPLAVVRAHLETLLLHRPPSNGGAENARVSVHASTLQALQNETDRLASLVDDLFTLSRGESGALQVQCEPTDIAEIVDQIAALMGPLVRRDGMIALSVEAPPGLPPALADGDRLRQILANLVRNAARHTPDGGIIVLSVAAEEGWIVVSVADTGEGIAPEHLPYIFDRFYRVDEARSRSGGGTGLGLAIVRELVELMGGRVTVESQLGEGSRFRVYLPRAPLTTHSPAEDGSSANGERLPRSRTEERTRGAADVTPPADSAPAPRE